MLVTYPVPVDQAVKAVVTISRLLGISASCVDETDQYRDRIV
jgi:hypothetical protein